MKNWEWALESYLMKKQALFAVAVVIALAIAAFWMGVRPAARMTAGYKAKIACSEIFVAKRDPAIVLAQEFDGLPSALNYFTARVDKTEASVSVAGPLTIGKRRASYREGYGCSLHHDGRPAPLPTLPVIASSMPWPSAGENTPLPDGVDQDAINAALDTAFAQNTLGHRGIIVIIDGVIVGERYAPGFSKDTPMQSWSAAKSVTATLAGAAVHAGYFNMDDRLLAPEWEGDQQRQALRWDDLIHMTSGLSFDENYYKPTSDANTMLFDARSAAGIAATKPLAHEPGTHWAYSSGTSNILARAIGTALEEEGGDLFSFARAALFAPIGASSFVLEPDASGNFIGSSFVYATLRDWARLGQLYLDDGVGANGVRLLPADWVDYVREPATDSNNQYGAQLWLNHPNPQTGEQRFPGLPSETFSMQGHEGQYVIIIPSARMLIVRFGVTRGTRPAPAIAPLFADLYSASQN